ncbi:hypothetical protein PVW47_05675 [Marinovum sp. SP66]|uniref:hypothetical protein n=1 Tax=Marinovum TaxID=367771 RepID=UPI00237B7169|nr:hypothetical protein [Marinovum sp. SP66]MDD9739262.1 hypothetical protein [Marinovum sp. SP66]
MAVFRIPAICQNCGLMFPTPAFVPFGEGTGAYVEFSGSASICPRCHARAPIPDGIFRIVKDSVKFFSSSAYTSEVHTAIELATKDYLRSPRKAEEIAGRVRLASPEAGRLFREWLTVGSAFVSAMAAVAMAVFAYYQHRGSNYTVEDVATAAFEEVYDTSQPDFRSLRPKQRPALPNSESKAHEKNRNQRRAERAKQRRDRRKH